MRYEIVYDAYTGDYRMLLQGKLLGYSRVYGTASDVLEEVIVERNAAINTLSARYPQEQVEKYVEQAEERLGPGYWLLVESDTALLADFDLFLQAQEVLNRA